MRRYAASGFGAEEEQPWSQQLADMRRNPGSVDNAHTKMDPGVATGSRVMNDKSGLSIGDLAKATGTKVETVRWGGSRDNKQEDIMFVETRPRANLCGGLSDPQHSQQPESVSGSGYPKFRNDHGLPEISIGVREFKCIGMSPPQDHPHVYVNMGEADTILCPYCATRFRFDPRLAPFDADPPDSFFAVDANPGQ
jgi:uncharacterized Zn-finger protein